MWINPILVGVIGTLIVEVIIVIGISLWRNKDENDNDKGNE